ncbi:hypothetical protein [Kordia sp.]|uniref:hypothetical protein n=1 Tax=Kordia sp. TaxID=1965332 RepID=UPI003D6A5D84
MKKLILFFITLLITLNSYSQNKTISKEELKIKNLISDFVSEEWRKVSHSKDSLLNLGESSIPYLIDLLNSPKAYNKLKNTIDLIYPGAEEFYGHGPIVNYDIDWIAIRAGWVLESLTFQDFGFLHNVISEKELMELHIKNYATYAETGKHKVNFKKSELKKLNGSIRKVKDWWKKNKNGWTPLIELKNAIFSTNTNRQLKALDQMILVRYKIKGFNQKWFDKELKKRIIELSKSKDDELSSYAKWILSLDIDENISDDD